MGGDKHSGAPGPTTPSDEAPDASAIPDRAKAIDEREAEALLLRRLQSQFGDLDLSALASSSGGNGPGSLAAPARATTDDDNDDDTEEDGDESSSLAEPTPEELASWQSAQFKLGQWARDAKAEKDKSEAETEAGALRRRRREERAASAAAGHGDGVANRGKEGGGEWEEVHPPPDLANQESAFFPSSLEGSADGVVVGPHPLLSKLAALEPEVLGGTWRRLYSSSVDGLSFPHLLSSVRGYDGPTVLLVGASTSTEHSLRKGSGSSSSLGTIGFYTASKWEENATYHGDDDCFLFRTEDDEVTPFRPSDPNGNFMYCHPPSSSSNGGGGSADHSTKGMCVGGTPSRPRLHLTERLESCRALPFDATFEDGNLLPDANDSLYYFDVDVLEVWGVGGEGWIEEALAAQRVDRASFASTLNKSRKVDKMQFLDDFRSGLVGGEASLFAHYDVVEERIDGYCSP